METIFDYQPTPEEIEECGFLDSWQCIRHGLEFPDPLTKEWYLAMITQEATYFDLYLLFTYRKNTRVASWYFTLIPVKVQDYILGFDYLIIPI
ncbi:hypothetical protein GCM10028808_60600 [Spirosoma migulaei]